MNFIQYKYRISFLFGCCLLGYGAFLFFKGEKEPARSFLIWGSLSIAFSVLLKKLVDGKTK